jgi:hexosaminidase
MGMVKVSSFSFIYKDKHSVRFIKMSQFHWHVVDSQSFPLYIPEYPELSEKGAYSAKEIYSSRDVKDIVQYAGAVSLCYH